MILDKKPLTMAQAKEYIHFTEENKVLEDYFKEFSKISSEKSLEIVEAVKALNNPKLRDDEIIKVADFLPKDSSEVNKIFNESGLTEEETNAIIEIVKKAH